MLGVCAAIASIIVRLMVSLKSHTTSNVDSVGGGSHDAHQAFAGSL